MGGGSFGLYKCCHGSRYHLSYFKGSFQSRTHDRYSLLFYARGVPGGGGGGVMISSC